jgi:hypothetical protein
MGRPTDYSEEMLAKARSYLASYDSNGDLFPSIAGLALYLDISRETVRRWSKDEDKAEFCGIVEKCLASQESKLTQGGIKGDFNPTITKLLLSKHGYSDKQEISGPEGGPLEASLTVKFVDGSPDT